MFPSHIICFPDLPVFPEKIHTAGAFVDPFRHLCHTLCAAELGVGVPQLPVTDAVVVPEGRFVVGETMGRISQCGHIRNVCPEGKRDYISILR